MTDPIPRIIDNGWQLFYAAISVAALLIFGTEGFYVFAATWAIQSTWRLLQAVRDYRQARRAVGYLTGLAAFAAAKQAEHAND